MKLPSMLIFMMLICSPVLSYAEDAEEGSEMVQGSLELTDEKMELVLEESGVLDKFEACKTKLGSKTLDGNVSDCLWNGIKDANGAKIDGFGLEDEEKEKVAKRLDDLNSTNPGDNNKDRYESLETGFLKEAKKDPAFTAFQDFMKEKLEKLIYGEAQNGKLSGADHMVFHDIYKSQLSKNVIAAMSSYCLDADAKDSFLITESKIKDNQKANIKLLSDTTQIQADPKNPQKTQPIAQVNFNKCISSLKDICYTTGDYEPIFSDRRLAELKAELKKLNDQGASKVQKQVIQRSIDRINGPYAFSQTRSCNVVTYIKQLKQNIAAINDLTKKVKDLGLEKSGSGFQMGDAKRRQQVAVYGGEKNEAITSITSKEFAEESGFKAAAEEEAKEFEKCMKKDANGVMVVADEDLCKNYLNKDKEEAQKLIAEADLRGRALEKKIKDNLEQNGEKGVTTYLTDQGYTEDQIQKMLNDPAVAGTLEAQITKRYEAEREAYIATVRDRIKSKTIEEDDKSISQSADSKSKLEKIGTELTEKTDKYTKLIHFNNIVSGFLETKDTDGNLGKNTNAMAMELESNGYDPDAPAPGSGGRATASNGAETHAANIKKALEGNGFKAEVDESKTNSLETDQIIKIFEYDGVKQEENN